MRKIVLSMVLLGFTGWLYAGGAAEKVMVSDAYVRAVPPGQPNSASFMVLSNHSAEDLVLVGAESDVAKAVELHSHTMKDGMMRMRQVEKIDLPAGETVQLQPGGLHVMVIGLQQKLVPGEKIDMALVFSDGSKLDLKVPVVKLQMTMQKPAMKHDMQHKMH
ncbi:MAG: copper chaperone PCu(A)C [Sedimenticola sp.]|uniref:Copper chaperone PCu(A)C n=1 Tax=Sedimenticola thiotaurini TaxID=1543721 RepID=A0A558DAJ6_9GAMM|nr:copper chaperone PCu(A)C [Sedimenticola sp.]TVT58047.1 MAG: copper chaperone PCu(A)C [Sedimenticola thiotaurini]MCW8921117.1 copper chaperone PCu(A)C [Sedimenticola sp.]MCW8946853.1 copper chaperone PCu(A)C [Sedimenticola sp.]MCW8974608.1 copper chaperone PCu(A)C [Sedimenticola sp.]